MSVTYCTLASLAAGLILHLVHRKLKHVRARAKLLAAGQSLTSGLGQLSVLSYNMLTDAPGRAKTLRGVSPEALDWSHRWRLLSAQISGSDADIICLQEVSMHSWQELVDLLSSRGYHPVLHTRSAAQPPDSCSSVLAVFYKDAKFALEWTQEAQHGLLVCLQHREDAPCQEPSASSLRSSDYLHVVNVHLEASPLLPGSRLHQLKAILGLLSEKLGSRKAAAAAQLVLAGDLGSTRQASPCAFLSSGRVDAHWTEAGLPKVGLNRESLEHAFPLQEAYQAGQRLPQGKAQVPYRDTDFIWTRGGRHLTSAHSPRYAVIGGGLAGVAVAWHLLQASSPTKPLSLDLIVQGEGLADGASGAAAGLLHPTSPRGKMMWRGDEAFLATRRLVDVAEAAGRKQIAWRQGVLRLAQTQRQEEQLRAAAETMPSARYVPASQLDAILAGLTEEASAGLGALLFSDGMALDTKGYLDGLWADTQRRARELGTEAVLHENTTVHDLAELNAGKGPYAGIVLAMGAGVADLAGVKDHLPPFMDMVAGISLTLELGAEGSAGAVHPERVHGAEPSTATTAVEPDAHSPDARCAGDLPAHASGWPEGAPSLAAMPYIAAQGSRRCVIGATWDRPAAPDQNPGTAPRTAGELLSQARALWPGLAAWHVVHSAHGTRVVSQRTDHGTPPYGGRLALGPAPALPPVWLMSGLGARGLLYHAWLAQLTAEGVLRGGEEHLPPELLRWRRRRG